MTDKTQTAAIPENLNLDDWVDRKGASRFLNSIGCPVKPQTLANLARSNNAGGGPPFTRIRWKTVRYNKDDLRTWAGTQMERVV